MRTIILLWKVNKWEADTFWSFVKCLSHLLLLGMRCRTTDIIMSSKERKETSKVSPWFVNMRTWWCPLRIFRIVGAWANPRSLFPENGLICYCTWKVLGAVFNASSSEWLLVYQGTSNMNLIRYIARVIKDRTCAFKAFCSCRHPWSSEMKIKVLQLGHFASLHPIS